MASEMGCTEGICRDRGLSGKSPLNRTNDDSGTLQDVLKRGAESFGRKTALSLVGGETLSYAGLLSAVRRAAGHLHRQGLCRRDRVAILSENGLPWVVAYFAVTASGAVAVPLMTEFPASQILHILDHCECRALVVSRRLREKTHGAEAGRIVIDITELSGGPGPLADEALHELPPISDDDLAAILYTSGTTGVSKGVMLTHRNIVFDAASALAIIEVNAPDRLLSVLPLAHSYECTLGMIAPLMHGASVHYLDRPASPSVLLPALKAIRPTIMLSVPLIIEKIYRSRIQPALSGKLISRLPPLRRIASLIAGMKLRRIFGGRLRVFAVGGSSLSPDVECFLREARFPYAVGYGLTETAPVAAGATPRQTRPRAVGQAVPGVEIRIAETGAAGGVGEIQIRGPNVMKGYYRDPQRTKEAFTPDGWLHSGDLGSLDRAGRLSIRGRIKTMILGASGENIYPEEIEAAINQSRYVEESLVYEDGAGVSALVQLKPDIIESLVATVKDSTARANQLITALLEQIKREVNPQLASYCRITRVELQREPFDKTPSQKIKRFLYPNRPSD